MFIFQQNFSRARAISACQVYRRENVKTTKFQQTEIWHLKTPGRLPGFPYWWDHVGRLQKNSSWTRNVIPGLKKRTVWNHQVIDWYWNCIVSVQYWYGLNPPHAKGAVAVAAILRSEPGIVDFVDTDLWVKMAHQHNHNIILINHVQFWGLHHERWSRFRSPQICTHCQDYHVTKRLKIDPFCQHLIRRMFHANARVNLGKCPFSNQMYCHKNVNDRNRTDSKFESFLKWGYPKIICFNGIFNYKPSILGYSTPIAENPKCWFLVWMFDKNCLSCARRRPEIPYQGGPLLMQRRPNNTQMIFVQHVFWQSCLQQPKTTNNWPNINGKSGLMLVKQLQKFIFWWTQSHAIKGFDKPLVGFCFIRTMSRSGDHPVYVRTTPLW